MNTEGAPLHVSFIADAARPEWLAGMEWGWPHRALLTWTPLDLEGEGVDRRLRGALWSALSAMTGEVGVPVEDGSEGWLWWRKPRLAMRRSDGAQDFHALFGWNLYFAVVIEAGAEMPPYEALRHWHVGGAPPDDLFPPPLRLALRSGVDEACFGVFARSEAELARFRETLTAAVAETGGALEDGKEPQAE